MMFRRRTPDEVEEQPVFSKGERTGGAIAHATPLLVGFPLVIVTPLVGGNLFMALIPCPIVAYVISRYFRRREAVWGAFQAMQAALIQLILLVLVFSSLLLGDAAPIQASTAAFVFTFLLFLYTMWGAWDTAWGYDFRYIFISNLVDRITDANLHRQEIRRYRQDSRSRNEPPEPPPTAPPPSNP